MLWDKVYKVRGKESYWGYNLGYICVDINNEQLTLAMKYDVSRTALMCLNQLLESIPDRKFSMDGFFNSHTKTEMEKKVKQLIKNYGNWVHKIVIGNGSIQ